MVANVRWQKATNCNKFVVAFCRNLTLVRMRLDSLAEWLRGWCLPKLPADKGKINTRYSPEWDVGGCSATVTGAVRVNQRRDGASPVVASIYCSPHPAVLQIAPAARLRGFCLYDSAPGELLCEDDGKFTDAAYE